PHRRGPEAGGPRAGGDDGDDRGRHVRQDLHEIPWAADHRPQAAQQEDLPPQQSQPRARDAPRGCSAVVPPVTGGSLPLTRTASIAALFVALLIPVVTTVLAGFGAFDYVTESRRELADLRLKAARLGDELSVGLALPVW